MGPAISIVMPSFQQGPYIERALRSILDQGIDALEILVIDGGSKDDTLDILRRIGRRDERVRWISEPDRGQAHAINKGLARARGPIIGWLNSDDLYTPGSLAKVLHFFRKNPDVDCVYGDGGLIDEEGNVLERYPTEPFDAERLWHADFISQPSLFFRKRVVAQCGYLNESLHYCLDYELWLRMAQSGVRFEYVPGVLSATRMHGGAKTIKGRRAMHAEVNAMLKAKRGRVPASWLMNYALVATGADGKVSGSTPIRLAAAMPLLLYSAFRWNRSLTIRDIREWLGGVRHKAQRAWRRRRAA